MTIKECIDVVDNLKPNQYGIPEKVAWLSFLDMTIINDVLRTHEGYDGKYDEFTGYSADRIDVGLIVPAPYDRVYTAYLKMKIDEENGETARYNNSVTLYNSYMMEYRKWYTRTHMPLSPSDMRKPISMPKQMDVTDAQMEQLRKLLYAELLNEMLKAVSNDKIYDIVKSFMDTNAQMLKGKDGLDGRDGKDGLNGMDGRDGLNGIGVQRAYVDNGELYITLTNGSTIKAGTVKGEKGDRGEAGAIDSEFVEELPTTNIKEKTLYFVKDNAGSEDNKYKEYMYKNGEWELIGSASVEVNLSDYVKKTDYATPSNSGGIVSIDVTMGIGSNNGKLYINPALTSDIDKKSSHRLPIVPNTIDYAVMKALTDSKNHEWTDEEKASALALLGGVAKQIVASGMYLYGADKDGDKQYKISENADAETIAIRDGYGGVRVNVTPRVENHATSKKYVDDGFVPKVSNANLIYGTTTNYPATFVPMAYGVPRYSAEGTLKTNTPIADNDTVSKEYVDGLIADLQAQIDALKG